MFLVLLYIIFIRESNQFYYLLMYLITFTIKFTFSTPFIQSSQQQQIPMTLNSFTKALLIGIMMVAMINMGKSQQDDDLIDLSLVDMFPSGYNHNVYGGYLNITFQTKAFHYFFFESQRDPVNDPIILWLNGGPGCSSLIGMVSENGPFRFKEGTTQMYINPYSWNTNASVIYLQSPSSVGFSVGSGPDLITNDTDVARDNLVAIIKFFQRYQNFRYNDFYLAGESYAGVYIPQLAEQILDYNDGIQEDRINLKGMILGNPCTHPTQCYTSTYYSKYTYQFLYTRGFLDEQQYQAYRAECDLSQYTGPCIAQQLNLKNRFISTRANIYNVFGKCYPRPTYDPKIELKLYNYESKNTLKHTLNCSDSAGPMKLFNTDKYRSAFHVGKGVDDLQWTPCSDILRYTIQSDQSYFTLPTLIKAGLKIFYFSGDLDAIVPIQGTIFWLEKYRKDFGISIKRNWRPWVTKDQNISGMVWELQGITFASFIGAGHMVPTDKPAQALEMLSVFLGDHDWKGSKDYEQVQINNDEQQKNKKTLEQFESQNGQKFQLVQS